jgi:hypothetical protein
MIIGGDRPTGPPPRNFHEPRGVGIGVFPGVDHMLVALLRLFALRPLLTLVIFGIPLFVLVAVGLVTILAFKLILFVILPIVAVVWLVRRFSRAGDSPAL